ncbi:smr domain-containing protein [Physcia stellaris]|nr:smr domain-containing protein [Physcia stellaris]
MSYAATTQLGGHAFNHNQSSSAETEYDRLRSLARQEQGKRSSCMDKAHSAYERGDGASAHELSEEGKRHGAMMDQYNKQASDFIFRENNAVGRVDGDTIDLHGQFVEEAEDILEQRIKYAQSTGQTHLHVSTASSAKATIPPITSKRLSPEWSKYVKNSACNTLQKQTQVECTSTSRVDLRKCPSNSPKVITDTIKAMGISTAVSNIKASNIRTIIISKTRISKAATKANSNHTINREIMNRTINKTKRSKRP